MDSGRTNLKRSLGCLSCFSGLIVNAIHQEKVSRDPDKKLVYKCLLQDFSGFKRCFTTMILKFFWKITLNEVHQSKNKLLEFKVHFFCL